MFGGTGPFPNDFVGLLGLAWQHSKHFFLQLPFYMSHFCLLVLTFLRSGKTELVQFTRGVSRRDFQETIWPFLGQFSLSLKSEEHPSFKNLY